jgi:hypothetical protein
MMRRAARGGMMASDKFCQDFAVYYVSCPANDFLDSNDCAADTSFTATDWSATLPSFHALAVTQVA